MLDLPDIPFLLLLAVFLAAMFQGATGVGFGLAAGPALLVAMDDIAAVQVSVVLSFIISVLLSPVVRRQANWSFLKPLLVGVAVGSASGASVHLHVPLDALKLAAAATVLAMVVLSTGLLERYPAVRRDSRLRRAAVGVASGAMTVALAMPGPPLVAYGRATRSGKDAVRATTVAVFLVAYPLAFAMQAATTGISGRTLPMCLALVAPVLLGTVAGRIVGNYVSERVFGRLIVGFLLASAAVLLFG